MLFRSRSLLRLALQEYRVFLSQPWDMRVLIVTNLVYGLTMPVIESFIGFYVMLTSNDPKMVVAYQLAVYTGIPLTFLVNGWLLRVVGIKRLYSVGMLLSGVAMIALMSLGELDVQGLCVVGVLMGMSFGLYWANRDFLALASTNDSNRNYYYGLENFFLMNTAVGVPLVVGTFIAQFGGEDLVLVNQAYQIVTVVVFALALVASVICHQGRFPNPPPTQFLFFRYHWLWNRMQVLAVFKGIGQIFLVTMPAMLGMTFVGKEGALGPLQSVAALLAAVLLYVLGRVTGPKHRIYLFALGYSLFALGTAANAVLFDMYGALLFLLLLALGRPLIEFSYFPIQMLVIDTVSAIENRNKYAYIFNQEFGFFLGRAAGCGLFFLLAYSWDVAVALRYALLLGVLQVLSIPVAVTILRGCARHTPPDGPSAEQLVDRPEALVPAAPDQLER